MSLPSPDGIRQILSRHQSELCGKTLLSLCNGSGRSSAFSLSAAGITLDYSKHWCTDETIVLFADWAEAAGLASQIQRLFRGEQVNPTEQRPALHTALRSHASDAPFQQPIRAARARMQALVEDLRQQRRTGFSNKPFTDVVSLGIGGSDLGPRLICHAMNPLMHGPVRVHFVANVDPHELDDTLAALNPETTLFIAASKSFSTIETLTNMHAARAWLASAARGKSCDTHFIAITANTAAAVARGIAADNVLPIWDWVGGRYSLWSAIGLPIAIALGWSEYVALLDGAADMDAHFANAPFSHNLPFIMAALECWYSEFWEAHSTLVMPYCHRLRLFPAYLQQLSMESLGKSTTLDGEPAPYNTGLVIWGEPGTNGQHSFMQLLHQGTRFIPTDFIIARPENNDERSRQLFANCLAQSRALMIGKSAKDIESEMLASGSTVQAARDLAQHRAQPGGRPSSTLLLDTVSARSLGALIALYEHKVFAQGVLWRINAFDQWGVELGKIAAKEIFTTLGNTQAPEFDASTNTLVEMYRGR